MKKILWILLAAAILYGGYYLVTNSSFFNSDAKQGDPWTD